MDRYQIELTGTTPLIMHNDNLKFREIVKKWISRPENKKISSAGDDRTPPFTWIGYCYFNQGKLCIPSDNLMTLFRDAGKKVPTGKKGASFKTAMAASVLVDQAGWTMENAGKTISEAEIKKLMDEKDFEEHEKKAAELGFELFTKCAKIGKAKHVRVRPRFENWKIAGSITILDESVTKSVLDDILIVAGLFVGLCDWRPGSVQSPGPFGKFTHKISKI